MGPGPWPFKTHFICTTSLCSIGNFSQKRIWRPPPHLNPGSATELHHQDRSFSTKDQKGDDAVSLSRHHPLCHTLLNPNFCVTGFVRWSIILCKVLEYYSVDNKVKGCPRQLIHTTQLKPFRFQSKMEIINKRSVYSLPNT